MISNEIDRIMEFVSLDVWESDFRSAARGQKERMKNLLKAIDKEFPKTSKEKVAQRVGIETLIWALLGGPILLFSLGLNGSVIIEIQGILERLSIRDITNFLSRRDPHNKDIIRGLIERKSLVDLATILNKIGAWDSEDLAWTKKISTLRNAAAHKNPRKIGITSFLDVDASLAKIDVIPHIIMSIHLLNKLSLYSRSQKT
jgi:hypothetical protein